MEKQNKNHKLTDSLTHKVNIFHVVSSYRFFHISCDDCKLKTQCESIKHKREICNIANETHNLLAEYIVGYVASFASDDFYIQSNQQKTKIHPIFKHLFEKYAVKTK